MGKRILNSIANVLSIVLYPLFVPTYGMALCCYADHLRGVPVNAVYWTVAIGGTLLLTCVLPLTAILIMMRRGDVKDLQITNASERTMPYLYAVMGFAFWCYLLIGILHMPLYINTIGVGATAAIALVMLINRSWKISAHLTALGGLIGGIMAYCLGTLAIPTWSTIALWLALSLLLMYARLWLQAHTPTQVVTGWLLGMSCTFVPYLVLSYVL
ncbi:MAG: hypothetical protein J5761_04545 [Paludibacteraceae bacterium]|nr:hypothetical protein [Paludibacteraceae bacterium]